MKKLKLRQLVFDSRFLGAAPINWIFYKKKSVFTVCVKGLPGDQPVNLNHSSSPRNLEITPNLTLALPPALNPDLLSTLPPSLTIILPLAPPLAVNLNLDLIPTSPSISLPPPTLPPILPPPSPPVPSANTQLEQPSYNFRTIKQEAQNITFKRSTNEYTQGASTSRPILNRTYFKIKPKSNPNRTVTPDLPVGLRPGLGLPTGLPTGNLYPQVPNPRQEGLNPQTKAFVRGAQNVVAHPIVQGVSVTFFSTLHHLAMTNAITSAFATWNASLNATNISTSRAASRTLAATGSVLASAQGEPIGVPIPNPAFFMGLSALFALREQRAQAARLTMGAISSMLPTVASSLAPIVTPLVAPIVAITPIVTPVTQLPAALAMAILTGGAMLVGQEAVKLLSSIDTSPTLPLSANPLPAHTPLVTPHFAPGVNNYSRPSTSLRDNVASHPLPRRSPSPSEDMQSNIPLPTVPSQTIQLLPEPTKKRASPDLDTSDNSHLYPPRKRSKDDKDPTSSNNQTGGSSPKGPPSSGNNACCMVDSSFEEGKAPKLQLQLEGSNVDLEEDFYSEGESRLDSTAVFKKELIDHIIDVIIALKSKVSEDSPEESEQDPFDLNNLIGLAIGSYIGTMLGYQAWYYLKKRFNLDK